MTSSNALIRLLYAVEAAGYAMVGSYETSAEWDAAALARMRPRAKFPRASVTPTLMSMALALLFVVI